MLSRHRAATALLALFTLIFTLPAEAHSGIPVPNYPDNATGTQAQESRAAAPQTRPQTTRRAEQTAIETDMPEVPFTFAISLGPNFNTGGSQSAEWFGSRPATAMQMDIMMNLAIVRRLSLYLDLGITFFEIRQQSADKDPVAAIIGELFSPVSSMKPSAAAGLAYTISVERWRIIPRAGIGVISMGSYHKSSTVGDTTKRLDKDISPMFVNAGVSAGYRLSRLCTLFLDASYRCPVQRATATYTLTRPDTPAETLNATSRSWGNDLTLSLGVKFHIGAR